MSDSSAIVGATYGRARSFTVSTSTSSSAEKAIARGSYYLHASGAGCWCKTGDTGVVAVSGGGVATQPAEGSPNGLFFVAQDQVVPLDVTDDSQFIATITESGSGSLRIVGPLGQAPGR